jgi:hypothetical protein
LQSRIRRKEIIMNTDSPANNETPRIHFDIRHLSVEDLARLGVSQIAYVKPVMMNGSPAFAIHAADGTPMAVTGNRDVAISAIIQHEMLPTMVH